MLSVLSHPIEPNCMITWHYLVDSKSKTVVQEKDISMGVEA